MVARGHDAVYSRILSGLDFDEDFALVLDGEVHFGGFWVFRGRLAPKAGARVVQAIEAAAHRQKAAWSSSDVSSMSILAISGRHYFKRLQRLRLATLLAWTLPRTAKEQEPRSRVISPRRHIALFD